jgi:hypothetical protein
MTDDNITRLDEHRPHRHGPVACTRCGHRWVAVVPDGTTDPLECPMCHQAAGLWSVWNWHVERHVGNPGMARVVGPSFRAMPECEGGGWYTDPPTAALLASAPDMLNALRSAADTMQQLVTINRLPKNNAGLRDALAAIARATAAVPELCP